MRVQLGAVYIDAIVDDTAATRPVLINRVPEPNEIDVPRTRAIDLHVTDLDADGLADVTQVFITSIPAAGGAPTEVLALNRPVVGFHADYAASSTFTAQMSPGAVNDDEHVIHLVRSFLWTSQETVTVRVVARSADVAPGGEVTFTYSFVVEDTTRPFLVSGQTRGLRRVRAVFSEPVLRAGLNAAGDALATRLITGGVEFLNTPNRIRCPGGNFTSVDVGRFLSVVGAADPRGDETFRITAVDSATVVQVAAPPNAPLQPFADAVLGPDARASVSAIALHPHRLRAYYPAVPQAGEIELGLHDLTAAPDAFTAHWRWLDSGADSALRATVTGTQSGGTQLAPSRTISYSRDNDFATYNAAALTTAATTNQSSVTLAYGTSPVPGIVVSVSGVPAARFLTFGDPLLSPQDEPSFSPIPISVQAVLATDVPPGQDATRMVDLNFSEELSPGQLYTLETWTVQDLNENTVRTPGDNPANTRTAITFRAEQLPVVARRHFSLYNDMLPDVDRSIDVQRHLRQLLAVFQEPLNLALWMIDRFLTLWDPDLTPAVDTLLAHLGNPFRFAYDLEDPFRRRLIEVLAQIYSRNGTEAGIEATLAFFFGQAFDVRPLAAVDGWELDVDELDTEAVLGPDSLFALYSFEVVSPIVLTATQRQRLTDIVEVMRPAHTHFIRIVEPA